MERYFMLWNVFLWSRCAEPYFSWLLLLLLLAEIAEIVDLKERVDYMGFEHRTLSTITQYLTTRLRTCWQSAFSIFLISYIT